MLKDTQKFYTKFNNSSIEFFYTISIISDNCVGCLVAIMIVKNCRFDENAKKIDTII